MRRRAIALICASAAILGAWLAAAGPASASRDQLMIFQDNGLTSNPGTSGQAFSEIKALGADVVKINVVWRHVATSQSRTNPTSPGAYNWHRLDSFVIKARRNGLRPFLSIMGPAPNYSVASLKGEDGSHRPSSRMFEQFAYAVGRRYSGNFAGLPRVDLYSLWNEPNLIRWIYPQRKRGVPISPMIYRKLYERGRRGLITAGHSASTILLGELFPSTRSSRKIPPVEFMREMACLSKRFRAYRGRARRRRGCPVRPSRLVTSGVAVHPYLPGTFVGSRGQGYRGLRSAPKGRDDVTIGYIRRLSRVMDRLASRGRLNRRGLPVWVTEYGFQTSPPDRYATPIRRAAALMDESEFVAYRNRRVKSYHQYLLRDEPRRANSAQPFGGFQMGLRFSDGRKKPYVYRAFEMPFFVRVRRGGVDLFGGVRAYPFGTAQVYQKRRGGSYKLLAQVRLNRRGYFRIPFKRLSRPTRRTFRLRFVTPSRSVMTRTKRPVKRR